MAKAVELTVPTGYIELEDTARSAHVFPYSKPPEGEKGFPCYQIRTFHEGSQSDGVIVQVSFEDDGIDEGHLALSENGLSYEEGTEEGKRTGVVEVALR